MWEARADYEDGTSVCEYYSDDGRIDADQIYDLEEILVTRKEGCTWYSVNWVADDEMFISRKEGRAWYSDNCITEEMVEYLR